MFKIFSNLSVKNKILFPILFLLLIAFIINYFLLRDKLEILIDDIASAEITKLKSDLEANIKTVSNKSLLISNSFTNLDFVKTAYEFEDEKEGRNFLREKLTPLIEKVKVELNIIDLKVHYHKPPAKSFLRSWRQKGKKDGGDDLSSFRNTVLLSNRTKKSVSGIEPGRGGIPMRGIAPITFDGKHYGTVEVFFTFDHMNKMLKLKEKSNYALFINKNTLEISYKFKKNKKVDGFSFITSVKKLDIETIDKELLKQGVNKLTYKVSGEKVYAVFPIKDFSGKTFGVIYYVSDMAKIVNSENGIMLVILITYSFLAVIIISTLYFLSNRVIATPLAELVEELEILSNGNLTETSIIHYDDEIGKISESYNDIISNLKDIAVGINEATNNVSNATDKLARSSEDLSTRTNEQAASITETSTTLEAFTSIVNQNSQNSDEASSLLENLNSQIQENVGLIDKVNTTMSEINGSSKEINNIVGVINDISFQTNLLALNAAVEAARAGEHGRGFAVVASEVRNLAGKTSDSSKSIQDIIERNMESASKGTELVSKTSELFSSIVVVMSDVVTKIRQINEGSNEQSTGINQINKAIHQLESVINQNAALVEELSGTGKNMKGNVQELLNQISKLKIEE